MSKYNVSVKLNLVVDSKNKTTTRRAVKNIPWEDVLYFDHPRAGFIRDFRIRVEEQPKIDKVEKL